MPRSSSSLLFALTLCLSFALVVWWTVFQVTTAGELAAAGERLAAGDVEGAARALGAVGAKDLADVARSRHTMFASEGAFFGVVLLGIGWLYFASVRRERTLRATQDRFLAAATHELKTPLATIVLLLESLRADRVPAEKRDRYLANGLLEAERLGRGLHNVLTAAGLRTVPIERDGAAVQLVLRNLLDNAIKYSPPGGRVALRLAVDGDSANIDVADQGRGLDAQELAHAFEPFYRGSDIASGGAGLGLHLVHELVAAHGGSVAASSAGRDRGASFRVRLPLGGPRR